MSDECDGKSRATTDRTCATCRYNVMEKYDDICDDCDATFKNWKPRPAAQDADECIERPGRYGEKSRIIFKARTPDMKEVAEIFDRELFDRFYQRRPSRSMSVEVEKAIRRLGKFLHYDGTGIDAIEAIRDFDLIAAALKEKV